MLKWPVCASFNRKPLSSTRVCPKELPRMERSVSTPLGARCCRSRDGSNRNRSIQEVVRSEVCAVTGSKVIERSASFSGIGVQVPVTTIFCESWAPAT
jgi:hypothetical protein